MPPETDDIFDFLVQKGYDAVPIRQNAAGLLLITAGVNGIPGLFILDTGAAVSVIDFIQVDALQLALQKDNTTYDGAGAGGQGLEVIPSNGNRLEIGNYCRTDFTLAVMSLEHALSQLCSDEVIFGIIGVDILKPARALIDYSNMMLYLLHEPS